MNTEQAVQYLRALGATQIQVTGNKVVSSCVLAPWTHQSGKDAHPSFAIVCSDTEESYANCFACGGTDLISLVHTLSRYGASRPRYDLKTALALAVADEDRPVKFAVKEWGQSTAEPYVTFPELWLATFMPTHQSPRARRYLRTRRVSPALALRLDLRYDTERDAVCFPIRDFEGKLCGLRGRHLAPQADQPRYHMYANAKNQRNTQVWYGEAWLDFDKTIVMCESVFDLAAIYPVYRNVVAPLTVSFSETRARRMRQATEIVTLFDADKGGDTARERIRRYLSAAHITHLFLPEGQDPGDTPREELRALLSTAVKLGKPR